MEARPIRIALVAAALLGMGASHRTQNFVVDASTADFARQVAEHAEQFRHDLAEDWLGKPLPPWDEPCPIRVTDGPNLGAGGVTSFSFHHSRPFGWTMAIQGTRERILDSVLPHEVTHTIFATHFGRPLPRWADEGACTTVESEPERQKQEQWLVRFLTHKPSSRGIAFNQMFAMQDYPRDIMPLYAQGHSVVRYLIAQGGRQKFVRYLGDGLESGDWNGATKDHYGFDSLSDLQVTWLAWVGNGSPELTQPASAIASDPTAIDPTGPDPTAIAAASFEENSVAAGTQNSAAQNSAAQSAAADATFVEGDAVPIAPPGPFTDDAEPSKVPVGLADGSYSRAIQDRLGNSSRELANEGLAQSGESEGAAESRTPPTHSWYAQRRDAARSSNARRSGLLEARSDAESQPLSRPQTPQRPVQTVLEWARGRRPVGDLISRARGSAPSSYGTPRESYRISVRTRPPQSVTSTRVR